MGDQNTGRYQPTAEEYEDALREIERLSAEVETQRHLKEHWMANHDNVVHRLRLAMQRLDLPVDRIPAIKRMEELQEELAALRAQIAEAQPVWIIFDGPPGHETGRFVEVETAGGKGVSAGEWSEYPSDLKTAEGLWRLGPFYTHPADAKDEERLDFITKAESTWHVQWSKRNGGPARYRMIDDGEPWGKWHDSARAAIDAAMKGSK